jgi:sulfotransferase
MPKEIFFINGMPRSGSTLLCNILAQNPDFHVTPTSGLSELISGIHQFWKQSPIIKAAEKPEKQLTIMKEMFQSYHSDTDRPIVFNKSRGWAQQIELVEAALEAPIKILTTIRPIPNILASMEKLYRKEIKNINSPMQRPPAMNTIDGRLGVWTAQDGLVGGTFNSIQDAFYRGHKDKFFFVDYNALTQTPATIIKQVYSFLDKPYFDHDFNDVQQYTQENDAEHGFTDLHTIRPKIQPQRDDAREILGQQRYDNYKNFTYNFLL